MIKLSIFGQTGHQVHVAQLLPTMLFDPTSGVQDDYHHDVVWEIKVGETEKCTAYCVADQTDLAHGT
ncbi:MAG: hypothetical protein IPH85_00095 [Ignavibacteria bacterium]|nr:hypothetical protein [Ignavibacteria bacterium]